MATKATASKHQKSNLVVPTSIFNSSAIATNDYMKGDKNQAPKLSRKNRILSGAAIPINKQS